MVQNSDEVISDMWISGQSLIEKNCNNSKISDDFHMKLGLVIKLDNRNKTASNKFEDEVMSANFEVIVFFPIYGKFGAIR